MSNIILPKPNTPTLDKRKKRSKSKSSRGIPDPFILVFSIVMALFGLLMIFDASGYQAIYIFGDQFHFVKLQFMWLMLSIIPATIIYFWDYKQLTKLSFIALIGNVILLVAVLIFGPRLGGSKRWLYIGGIPLQPAEFLKPVLIVFLAGWLSKPENNPKKLTKEAFKQKLITFLTILGGILLLVLLEPDLGTTMMVGITAFSMFFISSDDILHRQGTIGVGILFAILAGIAAVVERYRLRRVKTFLDLLLTGKVTDPTGDGYQIQQILLGIGSGGFWGKGFGQSRQKYGYLVENTAFTDSIFAIILEELGMISGIILIFAWLGFFLEGIKVSLAKKDKLGQLLGAGLTIWLTTQALINMGANIGLIPLTGIPLPLLTYGGSSTVVTVCSLALLLNVSRSEK